MTYKVPFNRPYVTGREFEYIREAIARSHLSSGGTFSAACEAWLEQRLNVRKALLVNSGTAALEMAVLLCGIGRGDEVILPSFTFASTANAIALRGAVPVFVDIRPDTLNLDECRVEAAITDRTRAIVVVHYAGIACDLDAISDLASRRGLSLIEDAAQGLLSTYRGRHLGTIGRVGALSFHETKNVTCGEGGALLINDPALIEPAEIVREKGTNRSRFFRGEVDKYSWVDLGSSYAPSEINAAFLLAQVEQADWITERRQSVWRRYFDAFEDLEQSGRLRRPVVPHECAHNAHLFYILARDGPDRTRILDHLRRCGVSAVFHYVPLHSSSAGRRYGRSVGNLSTTDDIAERLIRLPLWVGISETQVDRVISAVHDAANG